MRRPASIAAALVVALAAVAAAQQPLPGWPPGAFQDRRPIDAAAAGACSQATAFLARTSGLSGTETTAATTLICNAVTHGWWAKCDAYYNFATSSTSNANLNWIQNLYNITASGSPTFTADHGYTGNGTSSFLDTGFKPSTATSPNYVRNSGAISVYVLTNRAANPYAAMGAIHSGNTEVAYIYPNSGGTVAGSVQDLTTATGFSASSNSGFTVSRTASNVVKGYVNGAGPNWTSAAASINIEDVSFYILARHQGAGGSDFSADQVMSASICSGFTATDATNYDGDNNAYATTFGINNH